MMCRVLNIARANYYAWLHEPESGRPIEDKRLLQLIRSSFSGLDYSNFLCTIHFCTNDIQEK